MRPEKDYMAEHRCAHCRRSWQECCEDDPCPWFRAEYPTLGNPVENVLVADCLRSMEQEFTA